ncbi:MAG: DUF3142 domain-containing protein [Verrucomicrobiota bacterium]|nr:DUF3142 domain-containing protein [Verrucomicrobiota bacterium]
MKMGWSLTRFGIVSLLALLTLGAFIWGTRPGSASTTSGSMVQDVYVWQRDWSEGVRESILDHGPSFDHVVVLQTEVNWKHQRAPLHRVALDYDTLQAMPGELGLTLRVGPFPGPFKVDDERAQWLTRICDSMLAEAKEHALSVHEFQVDFDCAESKLAGYALWTKAMRAAIAPTPLVITVLPSWLDQASFGELLQSVDGYVLQVHALARPRSPGHPEVLCDPVAARKAVERAGQYGIPFRVALPTYAYLIAFDSKRQFVGLSAETPPHHWPTDGFIQEIRADPASMAWLVHQWTVSRPWCMQGLIWFRLPVRGDRMNWPWTTLAAVREGRTPLDDLVSLLEDSDDGLMDVFLENRGEADAVLDKKVRVSWDEGFLVAGDGVGGFSLLERGPKSVVFAVNSLALNMRLGPGQRKVIGWLRCQSVSKAHASIVGSGFSKPLP